MNEQTPEKLPISIREFVAKHQTVAVSDAGTSEYPHSAFYWRTAACVCLSGRVRPTGEREPNKADVDRVCKEANFDQYLFADVVRFLTAARVLTTGEYCGDPYGRGPAFEVFWARDIDGMRTLMWDGIVDRLRQRSGLRPSVHPTVWQSGLREFVTLFFSLFQRAALHWQRVNEACLEFCTLPLDDLRAYAVSLGHDRAAVVPDDWREWIEPQGTRALLALMGMGRWIFAPDNKGEHVYLGQAGAIMLGLAVPPPPPPPHHELTVQSDLSVLVGVDVSAETLVTLLRYCRIQRFEDVSRLGLNPKAFREAPAGASPGDELAAALAPAGPLPQSVQALLGTAPATAGGVLHYLGCSAILTSDDPATLSAVRSHGKLKGYLVPDGPPGLLAVRPDRDVRNFIARCRQLGFDLKPWQRRTWEFVHAT